LADILFQNNIIKNNTDNLLPTIRLHGLLNGRDPNNNKSVNLLNSFMFNYEELVNYVYINRPLNIMSPMTLSMYRGGYYQKYLKYFLKL